ncbi:MAG: 2TM domain-containing protein [Bacteroidales bacterium]|nr:2TM domain-containing protein [Bacteroidales bacterium]MBR5922129.1 2TM domain-containing protein [Bacteroidales bacterium]
MAENDYLTNENISVEEEARMINVSKIRVIFKIHIAVFLVLNLIIWALWFTLFDAVVTDAYTSNIILKVSLCITIVWLLIIILHYAIAYKWSKTFVEKELSRLKKQRAKQLKDIETLKAKIAETKNQQQTPTE